MVLPYAGMSVVKTNKRLRNANIRVMESIYIPQRGGLSGVYTLLYHAFFFPRKKGGLNPLFTSGSQITCLCSAAKSKSYTTSGSGPVFSNKFVNDA